MILPSNLISDFVKATKDKPAQQRESVLYGTIQSDTGYVKLDGSTVLTPIENKAVIAKEGDRVTVTIKDHKAIVTGNIASPAAREKDTLKIVDLEAINAKIVNLEAEDATIKGTITTETARINGVLDAHTGNIETLTSDNATIKQTLTAAEADIENLKTGKLSATDIEGKYANIDFSNITQATMKEFYATSGIIKDVVLQNGVITGELSGIVISGDLIKANTLVANKLVIQGENGLYYKLNVDGSKTEAEQTDYNSLNGTVIKAKSITASKINVTDLQAFGATIGGFKITESSLYSGVKSTPSNTTKGIYLGSDGQLVVGDATNYLKYITGADGKSKLQISADTILFDASSTDLATAISNLNNRIKTLEDSAVNNPIVASTEAEMAALLIAKNEGKIVKYIGPTGIYKQNTLYTIVDEN